MNKILSLIPHPQEFHFYNNNQYTVDNFIFYNGCTALAGTILIAAKRI